MTCTDEEVGVFLFNDLSDDAKEVALEKHRDWNTDYDWWDSTYEDVVTVGALIGIEIGTRDRHTRNNSVQEPDINFSGFWSQGDGACYSGWLHIAKLEKAVAQVLTHVGPEDKILPLAKEGEELYQAITLRLVELRMHGVDLENDGLAGDEVLLDDRLKIVSYGSYYSTKVDDCPGPDDIVKLIQSYVKDFASYIYDQLEQEHDYQTSDEAVGESLQANEIKFDADGHDL